MKCPVFPPTPEGFRAAREVLMKGGGVAIDFTFGRHRGAPTEVGGSIERTGLQAASPPEDQGQGASDIQDAQ